MTTFSYTTGNPSNLTGGTTASMNDIQGPFTDLRTFLNGGNADYSNIAAVVDSYYKTVHDATGLSHAFSAGTYMFANQADLTLANAHPTGLAVFRLDSADYPSGTRTAKLRIRVVSAVNNTAPGAITYTYGLYPMSAPAGAAGIIAATTGVVVAGTTVAITTPLANTLNVTATSDFSFPTAGYYALGVVLSGGENANTMMSHRVELQFRAT